MMRLRSLAFLTLLGLPVALLAHAIVFGGQHAVAGALHSLALAAGSIVLAGIVALRSRAYMDGTVIASRVRLGVGECGVLLLSAAAWFSLVELCEAPHAIPIVAVVFALVAATLAMYGGVNLFARSLSRITIALIAFIAYVCGNAELPPIFSKVCVSPEQRAFAHARRLFSRPPPLFS